MSKKIPIAQVLSTAENLLSSEFNSEEDFELLNAYVESVDVWYSSAAKNPADLKDNQQLRALVDLHEQIIDRVAKIQGDQGKILGNLKGIKAYYKELEPKAAEDVKMMRTKKW